MTALFYRAYQFGLFVERRKIALFSSLVLVIPLTALTLSAVASVFGSSLFSLVCHQNPNRSLGSLSLCSRCFGLYFGCGLAGLFAPVFSSRFSWRFLLAGITASLVLAVLGNFFSVLDGNYARLVLGFFVGTGFALLIKSILK